MFPLSAAIVPKRKCMETNKNLCESELFRKKFKHYQKGDEKPIANKVQMKPSVSTNQKSQGARCRRKLTYITKANKKVRTAANTSSRRGKLNKGESKYSCRDKLLSDSTLVENKISICNTEEVSEDLNNNQYNNEVTCHDHDYFMAPPQVLKLVNGVEDAKFESKTNNQGFSSVSNLADTAVATKQVALVPVEENSEKMPVEGAILQDNETRKKCECRCNSYCVCETPPSNRNASESRVATASGREDPDLLPNSNISENVSVLRTSSLAAPNSLYTDKEADSERGQSTDEGNSCKGINGIPYQCNGSEKDGMSSINSTILNGFVTGFVYDNCSSFYKDSMAECLRPRKHLQMQTNPSDSQDCTPEEKKTNYNIEEVNGESSLIFGKPQGCGWWPGTIVSHESVKQRPPLEHCCWIRWFGDDSVSEALISLLVPFSDFPTKYDESHMKGKYKKGVKLALEVAAKHYNATTALRLKGKSEKEKIDALIRWGMKKFDKASTRTNNLKGRDLSKRLKKDTCTLTTTSTEYEGKTTPKESVAKASSDATETASQSQQKVDDVPEIQNSSSKGVSSDSLSGDTPWVDNATKDADLAEPCPNNVSDSQESNLASDVPDVDSCLDLSTNIAGKEQRPQEDAKETEKNADDISKERNSEQKISPLGDGKEGSLVIAKLKGFDWWPGTLISHIEGRTREPLCKHSWIRWFGDGKVSEVKITQIEPFTMFPERFMSRKMRGVYKKSVNESLLEAAKRCQMTDLLKQEDGEEKEAALLQWALSGFSCELMQGYSHSHFVVETNVNKGLSPSQDAEDHQAENNTSDMEVDKEIDKDTACESKALNNKRHNKTRFGNPVDKPTLSSSVKKLFDEVFEGRRKIEDLCLGCGDTDVTSPHPLFEGGFCTECNGLFLETAYLLDEDGYQMYCTICNDGTEVIMCDSPGCFRCYCSVCIDMFCGVGTTDEIQAKDTWICFLCSGERVRLLKSRDNWQDRIKELFSTEDEDDYPPLIFAPPVPIEDRQPIRILALFDGIASGLVALRELDLDIGYYAASEIDEQAISVSHVKHNGVIHHIGDIRQITEKDIEKLGPFDLVIGGSPCNDLSIANPARKGIYEGTGRLFFEFFRLLMYARPPEGSSRPFFWLFENVVGMRHEDRKTISRFLQCNPCMVDAKEVSAMHRARYFWGNLPGMSRPIRPHPGDRLSLESCLEPNSGRKARFEKVRTITTRGNSLKQTKEMLLPVTMEINKKVQEDGLWCTEIERLFGFPDHYTDVANMGRTHRQKLLGSAWSVPVMRHLLSPLRDYFKTVDNRNDTSR